MQKPELELIYTDRKGRKWYQFKNPLEMPVARFIDANAAQIAVERRVTNETLKSELTNIRALLDKGKVGDAQIRIGDLQVRLESIAEEETLIQLAALWFFIEDEDPLAPPSRPAIADKVAAWREDTEAWAFFLHAAYQVGGLLPELSKEDLATYLSKAEAIRQNLSRLQRPSTTTSKR